MSNSRVRTIPLSFVVGVILSSTWLHGQQKPLKTYRDVQSGVSFDYPASWQVAPHDKPNNLLWNGKARSNDKPKIIVTRSKRYGSVLFLFALLPEDQATCRDRITATAEDGDIDEKIINGRSYMHASATERGLSHENS
jgi:hypothetical protein